VALKVYDPKGVLIIFAGVPISGKGETQFLSVETNQPTWAMSVGVSGEAARARSNDRSGRVTITLIQSSIVNDVLSALANVDANTPGGDGVGPLLIKDLSGRTLVSAAHAWIVKPADVGFAVEASERQWVIETPELQIFVGGN
jgi:hypothetical protein